MWHVQQPAWRYCWQSPGPPLSPPSVKCVRLWINMYMFASMFHVCGYINIYIYIYMVCKPVYIFKDPWIYVKILVTVCKLSVDMRTGDHN